MANDRTELSVSTEVLEKMAEIAAKEVDGVAGISKRTMDLKGIMKTKNAFKGVKVENINGAIEISAYICVKQNAKAKEVAEKVQQIGTGASGGRKLHSRLSINNYAIVICSFRSGRRTYV